MSGEVIGSSAIAPDAWRILQKCGAGKVAHSGRTLLDHLRGTHDLLVEWDAPRPTCVAGLFHSIYGTSSFRRRSLRSEERLMLRECIGDKAEMLAWMFCSIARPAQFLALLQRGVPNGDVAFACRTDRGQTEPLRATPDQFKALVEIECANLLEQGSGIATLRALFFTEVSHGGLLRDPVRAALRRRLREAETPAVGRPVVEMR